MPHSVQSIHRKATICRPSGLDDVEPDLLGRRNHCWVDITRVRSDAEYMVADLFAGAGIFSGGFERAGFRPVFGVEMDRDAAATFRRNLRDVFLFEQDIRTLFDRRLLATLGDDLPHVVVGGPPCTAFSSEGRRDPDDPVAGLYLEYLRVVDILRPLMFVLENVTGIRSFDDGRVIRDLVARAEDMGYRVSVRKLNAAWYGVPQTRERLIIVANRLGELNPYPLPMLAEEDFVPVSTALLDLALAPRDPEWSHDPPLHGPKMRERLDAIDPGDRVSEKWNSWRRLDPDGPSPTIMANHGDSAVHPWLPRALSVREMCRLQGIPDEVMFRGGLSAQQVQVCNAIPMPLARAVALALRTLLEVPGDPAASEIPPPGARIGRAKGGGR